MLICYWTLRASTNHVRIVMYWGCNFVEWNNSILLLMEAPLDLHAHERLRVFYLVDKISFILSLRRNLSRRFGSVVEHGFEVDVVYFYGHFS